MARDKKERNLNAQVSLLFRTFVFWTTSLYNNSGQMKNEIQESFLLTVHQRCLFFRTERKPNNLVS